MINNRSVIIGIVVGENSGDILGVGLIRSLKKCFKKVQFFGIGGFRMRSENMECWYDISELSIMGITGVIFRLPKLLNMRRELIKRFLKLKLNIFIGIDFPDFNISLEKRLKKYGITTIHYVSPSIWAWRSNRVFALKEATHNVLLLFPFEKSIYARCGIPNQFIGHPLADEIPLYPNKIALRQKFDIPSNRCCLAILPGSRPKEIQILTKIFMHCAKLLQDTIPNLEILIPLHDTDLINQFVTLTSFISVKFRVLHTLTAWEVMAAADAALLTSGTATLECMLAKCPMVVAYRMNPVIFMLIRHLIKVKWISLPNLLAGKPIVQEFIQKKCDPQRLASSLFYLLNYNQEQRTTLQQEFYHLHRSIKLHANDQATRLILKYINLL
ncbi:lipid-A-disaccharide synthase [Candidatus Blochmanniella floridana]|uniref:Lipid-A-disaccharide synthase n=1 Tax=Blochmanniella floridana TaxID=203907 RepID=LPXB_BLOFL|nr:RecName: Full=Lipid-A-disaccharide synthase [Candidatus Blochmannia floridanus]CAD83355.1 lipid-A-disaccharide synthase [Candidatus Blochmannia floridanus]